MNKYANDRNTVRIMGIVLETLMSGQNISFHSTDEDGNIENFHFYWEDGVLFQDCDYRCLNNEGIRYMYRSSEGEESSLKDLVYIIQESRGGLRWSLGWSNVDCEL